MDFSIDALLTDFSRTVRHNIQTFQEESRLRSVGCV